MYVQYSAYWFCYASYLFCNSAIFSFIKFTVSNIPLTGLFSCLRDLLVYLICYSVPWYEHSLHWLRYSSVWYEHSAHDSVNSHSGLAIVSTVPVLPFSGLDLLAHINDILFAGLAILSVVPVLS
jgi:hypothetical protein